MNQDNTSEVLGEKLKRLEEAWFDAERKLQELQRFTYSGLWEHDWVANKVWMSAELYRLYKIEESNDLIKDQGVLPFIHPDDREMIRHRYLDAIREKKPYRLTHRAVLPDGEIRYMEQICETEYDDYGKPLFTVGITQDITDKHTLFLNLYDSEFKFRDLLLKAPIPYQSLNEKGSFLFVNEALSELLGYSYKQLIGEPFTMVWLEEEIAQFTSKFEVLLSNGSIVCEVPLKRADGLVKQVVLAGRAVQNIETNQLQTHCMLFDITDRKKVEQELLLTHKLLQEINSEESRTIHKQLEQLLNDINDFIPAIFGLENSETWIELFNQCKLDLISASKVMNENDSSVNVD